MSAKENNVIGTRANTEMYEAVEGILADAVYYPMARIISLQKKKPVTPESRIAVIKQVLPICLSRKKRANYCRTTW